MGTIEFKTYLMVKDGHKTIEIKEIPCRAEYTPTGEGFDVDFVRVDEEGNIVSDPDTTLALEEAYGTYGLSAYIDRLIWDDISNEKGATEYLAAGNWR